MKTIEEAAKDFNDSHVNGHHPQKWVSDIFKAGVEFAQSWTSVEEELPPIGIPVVCKYEVFDKEYYWAGTFYSEERMIHFVKKHLMITHWRLIDLI